jgi:hypothetical protein
MSISIRRRDDTKQLDRQTREPEILALPDLGHRQSIHSGIGELRQQVRRRNDGLIESVRFRQHAELIESLRLIFRELA